MKMAEDYEENCDLQYGVHQNHLPLIKKSIIQMIQKNPHRFQNTKDPFVIADLGCADGKNSLLTIKFIIDQLRKIYQDFPVQIFLTDTPFNDFQKTMQTATKTLQNYKNIWIYSSGKSFYQNLFPQNRIDFMLCYTSIQWYTKKPVAYVKNLVYFLRQQMNKQQTFDQMEKIANQDWLSFVKARQKQLKPLGRVIVSTFTTHSQLTEHDKCFININVEIAECISQSLMQNGLDYLDRKLVFNIVCRQQKQYRSIFEEKKTGLNIIKYELFDVKDLTFSGYQLDKNKQKYSKKFSDQCRGYSESVYKSLLKSQHVEDSLIEKVLKDLYITKIPAAFLRIYREYQRIMTFNFIEIQKPDQK